MNVYFDTSALVALAMEEEGALGLTTWRRTTGVIHPFYSDFGRGEAASAFALSVRMGKASADAARETMRLFDEGFASWKVETVSSQDIAKATEHVMQFDLSLRLPDAIHIATAQRIGCVFLTLDRRQHAGAKTLGLGVTGPLADIKATGGS